VKASDEAFLHVILKAFKDYIQYMGIYSTLGTFGPVDTWY